MNDLRFALRQWLKAPGFTAVAILTLGLGIGACTLAFSWIRGVLVHTIPGARDAARLVVLANRPPSGVLGHTLSNLDIQDLGAETNVFAGVIGSQMEATSLRVDKESEWVWIQTTTANYFDVLGIRPVLGRTFRPGEDQAPRGNPVTVISHRLWQRRFGGRPDVLGRTVEIGRRPFEIIGVAPADFRGTMGGLGFELWVPITMSSDIPDIARVMAGRGIRWLHTIARLRDGVTLPHAQAAVDTVMRRAEQAFPRSNRNVGVAVLPVWKSPWGAQALLLPLLEALAAVASLLLLLVIANVANLLLARATARENEMAVRLALGARSSRLIRQTLVESLVLAALGGALGCFLAAGFGRALLWLLPATYLPIALEFPIDPQVLGFTALVAIGTGLLFGLVPAWRASQANLANTLKAGGRTGEGPRSGQRLRQALTIAEIAAALVLLVGMTLCARSFERARQMPVGLDPANLWLAGFRLPSGSYSKDDAAGFYRRLQAELAALPGVKSVALADWLPLGFEGGSSTAYGIPGYQPNPGENVDAGVSTVSAGYFSTLRVPLVRGREFDARDTADAPPVVIINERIAQRYFPDRDPLGLQLDLWDKRRTIIGIARTGKYHLLTEPPAAFLYLPLEQIGDYTLTAVVRTEGAPEGIARAVEQTAVALDPTAKPVAAMSMTQYMAAAYVVPRTAAVLLGVLGAVAILLAALGIYAVISWSVGRRVREIGVRMALGAARRDVAILFLRQGLRLGVYGTALGLLGSALASRVLATLLVDVSAADPLTYLLALPILAGVILLASWLPARRAATADPLAALRTE